MDVLKFLAACAALAALIIILVPTLILCVPFLAVAEVWSLSYPWCMDQIRGN